MIRSQPTGIDYRGAAERLPRGNPQGFAAKAAPTNWLTWEPFAVVGAASAAIRVNDASAEETLKRADSALYMAKNQGHNRLVIVDD